MKDNEIERLLSAKAALLRESASDEHFTATVIKKLVTKHRVMQIGFMVLCSIGLYVAILNSIELIQLISLNVQDFFSAEFVGSQVNQFVVLPLVVVFLWMIPMLEE